MPTFTPNFGLSLPLVNNATDQDLWGGQLNGDMSEIDSLLENAIGFTTSTQTASFNVTAATAQSSNTGSANVFYLCDSTAGNIIPQLPTAASAGNGFLVGFKKIDSGVNTVVITSNGTELIDAATTLVLSVQYTDAILVSDGTKWNVQGAISSLAAYAPLNSPSLTGTPTTPDPPSADSSEQIANTKFVSVNDQTCKAWVKFNGTNGSIFAQFNVSSVSHDATGIYTLNFTNPLADANYTLSGAASGGPTSGTGFKVGGTYTVNAVQVTVTNTNNGVTEDDGFVTIQIFGH